MSQNPGFASKSVTERAEQGSEGSQQPSTPAHMAVQKSRSGDERPPIGPTLDNLSVETRAALSEIFTLEVEEGFRVDSGISLKRVFSRVELSSETADGLAAWTVKRRDSIGEAERGPDGTYRVVVRRG